MKSLMESHGQSLMEKGASKVAVSRRVYPPKGDTRETETLRPTTNEIPSHGYRETKYNLK